MYPPPPPQYQPLLIPSTGTAIHILHRTPHQWQPVPVLPAGTAAPIAPPHPQYRPAATSPTAAQTRLQGPSGATPPTPSAPRVVNQSNLPPLSTGRHQPFQWVPQYLFPPPPPQDLSAPTPITGAAISIAPPSLRTSLYRPHQRAPQYLLPRPPSVSACSCPTSGMAALIAPPHPLYRPAAIKTAGCQWSN